MDSLIFVKAGPKDIKKLLPFINDVSKTKAFDAKRTTIMMAFLPFYAGCQLLEVIDHDSFPVIKRRFVFNHDSEEIVLIDYAPKTIETLNRSIPLKLDDSTVTEYIRFYFDVVIGSYGRFYVVENIDDIPWLEDPTPQLRKSMASLVQDVRVLSHNDDGYHMKSSMLFKSTLFEVDIILSKAGEVSITGQDVILEDMPVHDQALGH